MDTSAETTPETVMLAFNEAINTRDLDRLAHLMTDDHVFIDSAKVHLVGKEQVLAAWQGFFASFPEYRNVLDRIDADGETATAFGHSICPGVNELEGPAIWTAITEGHGVRVWQVSDADSGRCS